MNTAFRKTFGELIQAYGGWRALASSGYLRGAVVLTGLSWPYFVADNWVSSALSVLPALIGFSVAAYAIFFVILSEDDRDKLSRPMAGEPSRSPLLVLLSTISFAVLVQLTALVYAFVFAGKPIPTLELFESTYRLANWGFSAIGVFLLMYGVMLVGATTLTLFRLVGIKSRVSAKITEESDIAQQIPPPP